MSARTDEEIAHSIAASQARKQALVHQRYNARSMLAPSQITPAHTQAILIMLRRLVIKVGKAESYKEDKENYAPEEACKHEKVLSMATSQNPFCREFLLDIGYRMVDAVENAEVLACMFRNVPLEARSVLRHAVFPFLDKEGLRVALNVKVDDVLMAFGNEPNDVLGALYSMAAIRRGAERMLHDPSYRLEEALGVYRVLKADRDAAKLVAMSAREAELKQWLLQRASTGLGVLWAASDAKALVTAENNLYGAAIRQYAAVLGLKPHKLAQAVADKL